MPIKRIDTASQLPAQWDMLAENPFRSVQFLLHCEKYNPCHQRYYLCFDQDELVAGAIVYTLQLDLLTWSRFRFPVRVNIAGVPVSVSAQGLFGVSKAVETLKDHICREEKGFTLFLNLADKPLKGKRPQGITLPSIILENKYKDWSSYLIALRAPYRRRIQIIREQETMLTLKKLKCNEFTAEMYRQYLDVFERSNDKLEKLGFDFFRNLPNDFSLTACYKENQLLGWNISLQATDTFYFFMGGIDYELNKVHQTYFFLLTELVKDGMEKNATFTDLGQTAETPKMRLGGRVSPRYMEGHHSNGLLHWLLRIFSPLLSYRKKLERGKVFKGDKELGIGPQAFGD